MIRLIIAILGLTVFSVYMQAETVKATYDVGYGIFGKIGTAKAILKKQNGAYTIDISLAATGIAKRLSGNRQERHHSEGRVENGLLVSRLYEVERRYRSTKIIKRYTIDAKEHKVTKLYLKYKNGKLVKRYESQLDFFSKDDLLTLYFNLNGYIAHKHSAGTYVFHAVGAEKQHGRVTIILPDASLLPSYKKDLGNNANWYATAVIHQKIFTSKEGRLELAVGKDGITQKALLKDLILFGDIRAVRKE